MNIIFVSPIFTTLKIEKDHFLLTPHNPQILQIDNDDLFFQLIPNGNYEMGFGSIKYHKTCKNITLIDLYTDLLVVFTLTPKAENNFEKIYSNTVNVYGEVINIAIYSENFVKLKLSSSYYHEEIKLPFKPSSVEFDVLGGELLFLCLKAEKTILLAFCLPNFNQCLSVICDSFNLDSHLKTTTLHNDVCRHEVIDTWEIAKPFKLINRITKCRNTKILPHQIPYAFLEEVALGGDYSRFLADELKENAKLIPNFIGKFDFVLCPVCPQKENCLVIVYKDKGKFLHLEFVKDKICDLSLT